ncbi:PepSY domain-containing protein [Flavobacteriaceae bacterium XHP0103]|uniref:PepSY-associated TM helix domain-containing protein n=1 Tax=Marixanthotalea marina TaxID=2844359 RepID=UPI002989A88E|nr:PepSY-associated TM helix domain-containing protein [Marixanthotalea marina]MBU3821712.1 PepSY domain-containing protein [Marixanthotalea marina]
MKKKKYSIRKFINDIHLWLGLGSGIILFLVCLSGTFLAFEKEIKSFFSEEVTIEVSSEKKSIGSLSQTLKAENNGIVTGVTIPSKAEEAYVFSVKKDANERRGSQVLVNPYTASIHKVGKSSADGFMFSMFRLHRWLLLDTNIGRPIVGIATIIFLLLSISGIVLWFPKKVKWKNLKQGFKIKTNANWKRINHDLHNTLGFYACIVIIIMCLTGLCWSFEGYRKGLGTLIGTEVFNRSSPQFDLDKTFEKELIPIDEAITIANKTLNYNGKLSVSFPNERTNYYVFRKTNDANWSPVTTDNLYMDPSGDIMAVERFSDKPLNVQIASLIKPIHTGEIFGTFSKLIYFLACLIATSLPITGTIIWLNKLKKKRKKAKA